MTQIQRPASTRSILPELPGGAPTKPVAVNHVGDGLDAGSAAANRDVLAAVMQKRGMLNGLSGDAAAKVVNFAFTKLAGTLQSARAQNDGRLDESIVGKLVDKDAFDKGLSKTQRRAVFVASGAAIVGLAIGGGVNIGFEQIFTHWHSTISSYFQTGLSTSVFFLSGMLLGAFTGLGVEMATTPLSAWFTRLSFKGYPIISHISNALGNSLQAAYNAANQVDGRIFTAAATLGSLLMNLGVTMNGEGGVNSLIRQARKGGADKAALLEEAGEQLGGKLIGIEVTSFHIDPMFIEIMGVIHKSCGAAFDKLDSADRDAIIASALTYIRKRPSEADSGRPDLEQAITNYFKPFLSMLVNGAPTTGGI